MEAHWESLLRAVWADVPDGVPVGDSRRPGQSEGNLTEGRFWAEEMSPKTEAVTGCCGTPLLPLHQNSCDFLQEALKRVPTNSAFLMEAQTVEKAGCVGSTQPWADNYVGMGDSIL